MDRRGFFKQTTIGAASVGVSLIAQQSAKAWASERVRVGVIGAGGRALALNQLFSANPTSEVVAIADIDSRRLPQAIEEVAQRQQSKPRMEKDFRKLIDDPNIDAIAVGTPDHWHAIPTILACMAGKDVYVEKPDSHNIVEGQRMVAAMRKYKRVVQMGSQHRSTPRMKTALEYIRSGALGRCLVAKAWEVSKQGSIGKPPDGVAPPEVDYETWLGPAPKRPFNPVRFHGNWRWFFDYGTGDLGNDGVHRLDMAVAALDAACAAQDDPSLGVPTAVTGSGGKWYFDDLQEFPDTMQVTYEYGGRAPKILTYEMRVWASYGYHGESEGSAVYGDKGYIVLGNTRWRAYDQANKLVKEFKGGSEAEPHVQDFLDCIKSRAKPACDLETVGHAASILCHTGNISWRVGRKVVFDSATETFVNDDEANALRTRPEYRKPWLLPDV